MTDDYEYECICDAHTLSDWGCCCSYYPEEEE